MATRPTTSRFTINMEDDNHHHPHGRSTASVNLSKLIGVELDLLEEALAKHEVEQVIIQINDVRNELEKLQGGERIDIMMEIQELKKKVGKIKSKVPFNLVTPDDQPNPYVNRRPRSGPHKGRPPPIRQDRNDDDDDDEHPTSQDLISFLDNDRWFVYSLFLRIFMLFPGKAVLKLSLLACWEEVHGLGEPGDKPELHVLVSKGIIKPVYKTCSRTVSGFRMHPFVRSTLSAAFSRTVDSMEWKCYLVNSIEDEEEDVFYDDSMELSTMKHLKFLHLGKWQKSSAQHIEMEDPELYFKNMKKNMYDLRYISFRGISMIKELPKVLNKLVNLNFLDLRACYNLEAIPSDIGHIWKCLTHLDMSECYFLDHMPASLSRLHHLCVLKGFYVGESNNKESCALQDLCSLRHLWKLNIYTSVKGFPNEDQITAIHGFVSLRKLTISWGGCSARREECKSSSPDLIPFKEFSFQLEKLDLQCVPNKVTRHWLKPSNFQMLKKLYIRGGEFNDLGGGVRKGKGLEEVTSKDDSWSVEILRLKHLREMHMDWSQLVHLFPKLVSLEKVECPNLTGFPCDNKSSLWMKTTQNPLTIPIPTYTHGRKFHHGAWRRGFTFL